MIQQLTLPTFLPNPLQNAQQHQHTHTCEEKNHVCKFHYSLFPMSETKYFNF
jgi:hypothetical protein